MSTSQDSLRELGKLYPGRTMEEVALAAEQLDLLAATLWRGIEDLLEDEEQYDRFMVLTKERDRSTNK